MAKGRRGEYRGGVKLDRPRLLALFMGLILIGSWGTALGFRMLGGEWGSDLGRSVAVFYAFPVLITTVAIQGIVLRQPFIEPLGLRARPNRFWFAVWVVPLTILVVSTLVSWLVFDADVPLSSADLVAHRRVDVPVDQLPAFDAYVAETPPPSPWGLILMALPAGLTFGLFLALVQEVGFRGFLFREAAGGFWRRSIMIGVLWGVWMAPLSELYFPSPPFPLAGALLLFSFCVLFSPVLVYIRVRSASLIAVAATHGTLVAFIHVMDELAYGVEPWLRGPYGVSGLFGVLASLLVLFVHDKRFAEHPLMTGAQGLRRSAGPGSVEG